MQEIDKISGLPKDLFDMSQITKEQQKIKIRLLRRRFGKMVTVVSGFESENETKELSKKLKKQLACGGTFKDKEIELQGEHIEKVKKALLKEGYKEELIDA